MPPQRYSPMFLALIIAIILIRCIARVYTLPDAQASDKGADLWGEEWKSGGLIRPVPILGSDGLLENIDGTPYMG